MKKITIIIPYNKDRGYLQEAINSVPKRNDVELLVMQGDGLWPENFNKALNFATGDYIKWLHEDDLLLPGAIDLYFQAFEDNNIDFVHGNAFEMHQGTQEKKLWVPGLKIPTLAQMLQKNYIHSSTLMYRKDVFEVIGQMNESPNVYSFEEFEFNLRCLEYGLSIGYVDAPLSIYRRHPKQIIRTVDMDKRTRNRNILIEKYIYASR